MSTVLKSFPIIFWSKYGLFSDVRIRVIVASVQVMFCYSNLYKKVKICNLSKIYKICTCTQILILPHKHVCDGIQDKSRQKKFTSNLTVMQNVKVSIVSQLASAYIQAWIEATNVKECVPRIQIYYVVVPSNKVDIISFQVSHCKKEIFWLSQGSPRNEGIGRYRKITRDLYLPVLYHRISPR